ncbi:40S ribosomal protein S17 [Dinochytrium kinnereticum]|nr:40S ribosomal protein S17 [Dinochytrium kinnereticum]
MRLDLGHLNNGDIEDDILHTHKPLHLYAEHQWFGAAEADGWDGWMDGWMGWIDGLRHLGRVRTKTVKKASRVIIEKYYPRLTLDFQTNKKICDEVAIIASKRLRNKIAGFTTHLMKRIQRGPVRGISFKLQEEERERKDNYVPEVSALAVETIEIDKDTEALLKALSFENIPGVQVVNPQAAIVDRVPGYRGDRPRRA